MPNRFAARILTEIKVQSPFSNPPFLQLRDTQTECTDGNCDPTNLPGGPAGGMMMWTMLWGLIALGMYFMRPNSMRNRQLEPEGKPGPSSDGVSEGL